MTKELMTWLDNLLTEIDGLEVRRKSSRRLRVDVNPDALPALLELLRGRASYVHLSAISCVDWPEDDEFELVANGREPLEQQIARVLAERQSPVAS